MAVFAATAQITPYESWFTNEQAKSRINNNATTISRNDARGEISRRGKTIKNASEPN